MDALPSELLGKPTNSLMESEMAHGPQRWSTSLSPLNPQQLWGKLGHLKNKGEGRREETPISGPVKSAYFCCYCPFLPYCKGFAHSWVLESMACNCITTVSAFVITWGSPCAPLCVCIQFSLLIRTSVIGSGPTSMHCDLMFTDIRGAQSPCLGGV